MPNFQNDLNAPCQCEDLSAADRLLSELARGEDSIRREGSLSIEEAFAGLED